MQFTYVIVPADINEQMSEAVCAYKEEDKISCLTELAKKHMAQQKGNADEKSAREAFQHQLVEQMKKRDPSATVDFAAMDPQMLEMIHAMQMVDIVPLLSPSLEHDYDTVNMYVDDRGVSKNLPTNLRASQIAQACGLSLEVKGDAIISRARDTIEDAYDRKDFKLTDLSTSSDWMPKAIAQNAAKNKNNAAASIASTGTQTQKPAGVCVNGACAATGRYACGACKAVKYCSPACQKVHWPSHKAHCCQKKVQ